MARYMLVCRSVENNPNKLILDKIGFVRYFATAVEVFAQERCWL